jgi:hypothetical protein
MDQQLALGLERKQDGMDRALIAAFVQSWKNDFRSVVEGFLPGRRFTSEDVLAIVGLPSGGVAKDANNAVGAMVNGLARRGIIRKTSTRVQSRRSSSHGAELIVWERS